MNSVARTRLLHAILVLGLLFVVGAAISIVHRTVETGIPALSGSFMDRAQERLDSCEGQSLPCDFEREVLSLQGFETNYVDEASGIACFVTEGSVQEALSSISAELVQKGWTQVAESAEGCASFIKEGGAYRWLFIQYSQVGKSTCVVVWSQ